MKPTLIKGGRYQDHRGSIRYNNHFDASKIKRLYMIENIDKEFVRGWQGHKIEQRWFSAVVGSFVIHLIRVDDWENPNKDVEIQEYRLNAEKLDMLHVPAGYISSIKAECSNSRLLVMADYHLNEIQDEFRYPLEYFD